MIFKLLIENDDGEFRFHAWFKTAKSAWNAGNCYVPMDKDFQVVDEKNRRLIFDDKGNSRYLEPQVNK